MLTWNNKNTIKSKAKYLQNIATQVQLIKCRKIPSIEDSESPILGDDIAVGRFYLEAINLGGLRLEERTVDIRMLSSDQIKVVHMPLLFIQEKKTWSSTKRRFIILNSQSHIFVVHE